MTPAETFQQVDAFNCRAERQMECNAWIVQHLAMWKDHVPSIDELLGRETPMTLDEKLAAWAEYLETERVESGKTQDA